MQRFLSSFSSNLYWFYLYLLMCSKEVGFVGHKYRLKKYNLVSGTISPRSLVTKNEVLFHVDYSESYENKPQREIQSDYFGHTRFSIFAACCYTVQKMKFSSFLQIWSHLLKKSLMENFTYCAVKRWSFLLELIEVVRRELHFE